jgi:hypothetical protein
MADELSVEVVIVFNWVPKAEFCECSDRAVFVKGKEVIDRLKSCEFFKKGVCYYVVEYELTNSVALVRERTIPTERPPLVDEVSDNFCR